MKKVNGHNNLYIITYGNRKYDIDRVWRNEEQYSSLTEARKNAKEYCNATIFKLHFAKDSGDLKHITEIY